MTNNPCPNCGGSDLFRSTRISARSRGTNLLPGLGPWFTGAFMRAVVCRSCGLVRYFVEQQALDQIDANKSWKPVFEAAE